MKKRESTFWRRIKVEGVQARREMVRDGVLLPANEFCLRLGVSETKLARLRDAGSVFSIEVDGVEYYPALLAEPGLDRKRLQSICRILVPAPPASRLDYLSSARGSLGGMSPLDAVRENRRYHWVRETARAWAAEWSRTAVQIYIGRHANVPDGIAPVYTAAKEIDPRTDLWRRALAAMRSGGYVSPLGPYPSADTATVFIVQSTAGQSKNFLEARLDVVVRNKRSHVSVVRREELLYKLDAVSVAGSDSIVSVVTKAIATARKQKSL